MANHGIARFQKKHDEEEDPDKKKMYNDHLTKARSSLEAYESPEAVLAACVDSMSDYLDSKKVLFHFSLEFRSLENLSYRQNSK